jgi:Na+/H+ antiporter NhaD/arsenite permease-like protein
LVSVFQLFDFSIFPSLAFLFGIAAQFRAMDGTSFLQRMVGKLENRVGILYAIFLVASLFSPFILNDVVIIILTPVVVRYAKHFKVDAAPLLVAEITMTNVASSLTPLGNPQNILLWTSSRATFSQFVSGTWLPVLISGVIAAAALFPFSRRIGGAREISSSIGSVAPAIYLVIVATAIILSDFVGIPSYVSLGAGFLLGFIFTFRQPIEVVKAFDVRSLLTLYAFVGSVAVASFVLKPILVPYVQPVASGQQPYSAEFLGTVSNFISNVPATQLVLGISRVTPAVASETAVSAGLAGNISPLASFANILALQIARRGGIPLKRTIALQFVVGLLSFLPAFL